MLQEVVEFERLFIICFYHKFTNVFKRLTLFCYRYPGLRGCHWLIPQPERTDSKLSVKDIYIKSKEEVVTDPSMPYTPQVNLSYFGKGTFPSAVNIIKYILYIIM